MRAPQIFINKETLTDTNWLVKEINKILALLVADVNQTTFDISESIASLSLRGDTFINVIEYGAVGDGTTDDTASIQDAIDAVIALGGGTVYFPAGEYLISDTIDIAPWYGSPAIIIRGDGYGPWNQDGVVATAEHATLITTETDAINVFNIASTSQTVIENISIRDNASSRTSGAAIYCERYGNGITSDDGTVTGVYIKQVSIKGFYDGIRTIRLQSSTIDQVFIEDCERDGIRLESSAAGGGTSTTLQNCFVKECGQDNYSVYGMSYTLFNNCASDLPTRHGYMVDGTSRDNTSISFVGCGMEHAGDDGIHITSSCFGISIIGCGIGPTTGDGIYTEGTGVSIIGGKIQQTTGYGINVGGGNSVSAIGVTFSTNTLGQTNSSGKLMQLMNNGSNVLTLGNSITTGSTDSDIILKNSASLRSVDNAGSTTANYQIRGSTSDSWIYGVPSTSASHFYSFAGTNRLQLSEEHGAGLIRILGEASADVANPSANQAKLYLKDNGSGKTQLLVRFGSGAPQVIATEP